MPMAFTGVYQWSPIQIPTLLDREYLQWTLSKSSTGLNGTTSTNYFKLSVTFWCIKLYFINMKSRNDNHSNSRFNLLWKRSWSELGYDQHVSVDAIITRFPFLFFNPSGFSIFLITTCPVREQGCIYVVFFHQKLRVVIVTTTHRTYLWFRV